MKNFGKKPLVLGALGRGGGWKNSWEYLALVCFGALYKVSKI